MASSDEKKAKKILAAASSGNLRLLKKMAEELNESKIEELKDEDGLSAFHLGAFHGRTKICQYFVEDLGFHVDFLSPKGETPLFSAVVRGHVVTVKYLISHGANPAVSNKKGITPLHYAAQHGHIKLVKYLLSLGVPVDATFSHSAFTPLILAAQFGQVNHATSTDDTPLFASVRAGSLECTKLLVKAGADVNLKCPLAMAVHNQSIEIIKCLLDAGADPNVCSIYGQLPIETAGMGKNRDIVEMLIPLTSPISEVRDWSVRGIRQYVNSDAYFQKNKVLLEKKIAELKGKGADSFEKKEYVTAAIFYSKAIGIGEMIDCCESCDAALYSNRSLCWHRVSEGDQALKDALMAHRLRPEWPKAYYRIGAALMLLEDYVQASNAFMDGLLLDPTNTEMRNAHREALACMLESSFGDDD